MSARVGNIAGVGRVACDSLVALGNATADGAVLFAKNSDRPAGECQPLVQLPAARHPPGARVRCQYIEVAQVRETARLIGSRPYWLWGVEHGMNEHGVAIGNHTVFAKDELAGHGLIGMDLVRLGLERAATAGAAVEVVSGLIETHGQGGSGYADKEWPYHNSFLIADGSEAFLLETSDRQWAVRRVRDVGSASNHLSIGTDWDALAEATIAHAVAAGWWSDTAAARFDFAAAYRDTATVPAVISSGRYRRTCELLAGARGRLTPAHLRAAMRDHADGILYHPGRTPDDERYFTICMHAEPVGTTTASMIARVPRDADDLLRYWGCLGAPCIGVFLPYYLDGELPERVARGGALPSADSPWWRFNALLALVEADWQHRAARVRESWDAFETLLADDAADIESEAVRLRRVGRRDAAARLLTRFMDSTVDRALARLETLIGELQ